MVALERINICETVGRKNNWKLNFFSIYFVRINEEIHLFFKNSEKYTSFKQTMFYHLIEHLKDWKNQKLIICFD